ncbi:MAG: MBOAT family protein [Anaerolineales bacterium]
MSFTSLTFWIFFALVFSLHYLARTKSTQNIILLIASYMFYAWLSPGYTLLLALLTLTDYFIALRMEHREKPRRLLWLSLVLNLGTLAFFKYFDLLNSNLQDPLLVKIILPAGMSFYILKKLAYVIDVSRKTYPPVTSLVEFALFTAFFPQLIAGPIDRAQNLIPQIQRPRRWQTQALIDAWPLIVMGLFKKVVVADTLKSLVDRIFWIDSPAGIITLVGALAFTVQILADFSGYTDMARGIARLLGFETPENFDTPYLSLTPSEFWNRWHITLSHWLRDYIFFPTRRALVRHSPRPANWIIQSAPPLLTMFASGIWHGAGWTFVVWGLYYGVLIVIYQMLGLGSWKPTVKWKQFLGWLVMFSLTVFGWLLFRAPSLGWVWTALTAPFIRTASDLTVGLIAVSTIGFYALPLTVKSILDRRFSKDTWPQIIFHAAVLTTTLVFINRGTADFIYAQF